MKKSNGLKELLNKAKTKIGQDSFDGWVENNGENCDGFEEHVQLLREKDALYALATVEKDVVEFFKDKVAVDCKQLQDNVFCLRNFDDEETQPQCKNECIFGEKNFDLSLCCHKKNQDLVIRVSKLLEGSVISCEGVSEKGSVEAQK